MSRPLERAHMPEMRPNRAVPAFAVWILGVLALAPLLWACRGAPLGTAVADDYFFLADRAFGAFDPLSSMGVAYYWRPVSRQLYFGVVGPFLVAAPWSAVLLHAALLVALFALLHSLFRRSFSAPVALAIAAFPLISEPARALLTWPSGAQYLLPAVLGALALREAIGGRLWSSMLAALGAVLSNETAVLVLPLLPMAAARGPGARAPARQWIVGVAIVALVWALGYLAAMRHGVRLPAGIDGGPPWTQLPALGAHALAAALNLEDLPRPLVTTFAVAHASVLAIAAVLLMRRAPRERLGSRTGIVLGGAGWFVVATLPLTFLLFDWNGWRAWLGAIGLGVAATAVLGLAAPALAWAFVALRLAALLLAPPAPAIVTSEPPATDSKVSFARLVRWQRTVGSTHDALAAAHPRLPRGAAVRYWSMPRGALLGFQDSLAVQVWYRDPALGWERFGGAAGLTQPIDAMVEYLDGAAWPAVVIEPAAIAAFQRAGLAMRGGRAREADSLLAVAERSHRLDRGPFRAAVELNRGYAALDLGDATRAEALARASLALDPTAANAWAFLAELAMRRNDRAAALDALEHCFELDPRNPAGLRLAAALR